MNRISNSSENSEQVPEERPDIMSYINISQMAASQYRKFAQTVAASFQGVKINPQDIPDEKGCEQADGSLLIYVDLPNQKGRLEFTIPAGQWVWRDQN